MADLSSWDGSASLCRLVVCPSTWVANSNELSSPVTPGHMASRTRLALAVVDIWYSRSPESQQNGNRAAGGGWGGPRGAGQEV